MPWLPGYEGSSPVRIGNEAHAQLQLDVYGEVMDALHQARQAGLRRSEPAWAMQLALLAHLEEVWREPDYGLWEVRSAPRHFTYSRVMAWVAFDRAIKSVERFGLAGPVDRWRALRDEIHSDVCTCGFDSVRNTFVQSYGARELDASLLLIPAVGFLPIGDSRVQGTIAAIEKNLLRDGFVLRYDTLESDDGLPAGEGAFLACSFWLADVYAMCGRLDEANALFDRLVALSNDLGLLAEEYDVATRRLVGNFPQAFSHLPCSTLPTISLTRTNPPSSVRAACTRPGWLIAWLSVAGPAYPARHAATPSRRPAPARSPGARRRRATLLRWLNARRGRR